MIIAWGFLEEGLLQDPIEISSDEEGMVSAQENEPPLLRRTTRSNAHKSTGVVYQVPCLFSMNSKRHALDNPDPWWKHLSKTEAAY